MSLARAGPTSRGSRWVPPAPGMTPSRISGWPSLALSRADPEVGAQRQLAAAAERVAGDRRDHRLRDPGDRGERRLQRARPVDHVGVGHGRHLLDVGAGGEHLLPAVEHHGGDVVRAAHLGRGRAQLLLDLHVQGVHRRPVQPDRGRRRPRPRAARTQPLSSRERDRSSVARSLPDMERLGAHADATGTTFAVYSGGEAVELCLYDEDGTERRLRLPHRTHGVWHGRVAGVGPGTRYGYRVHGPWDPRHGHRYNPAKLLLDPYARAIDGPLRPRRRRLRPPGRRPATTPSATTATRRRSCRGRSSSPTASTGRATRRRGRRGRTRSSTRRTCAASRCSTPRSRPSMRGTYAGLAHPAVIEHLRRPRRHHRRAAAGAPVRQRAVPARRGRANYWGYNSVGFFAPHADYASGGRAASRSASSRRWSAPCTPPASRWSSTSSTTTPARAASDGPTLCCAAWTTPPTTGCATAAATRTSPAAATPWTCGTRAACSWSPTRCATGCEEMHVDGFRFDLAPTLARRSDAFDPRSAFLAVVGQDPVLSRGQADRRAVGRRPRRLPARPVPAAVGRVERPLPRRRPRLLAGRQRAQARQRRARPRLPAGRLVRRVRRHGRGPLASVNFVTAHDGFTLRDLVTYEHKHNEANGEGNRDGTDHNRSWNCGVEGPTDRREVQVAAPPECATCSRRCCCRPASRC